MTLLAAALLVLAAIAVLFAAPPPSRPRGGIAAADVLRGAAVAVAVVLPLLFAARVLSEGRERIEALRFVYAGKKLTYGPGIPITAGGSGEDADSYEDLHASRLTPRAVRIEPASEETAAGLDGVEPGDPVLHLRSPSPVVRANERYVNSYPLADGDRIVLADGGDAIEIVYQDGVLSHGGESFELPGTLRSLVQGPSQIFYLPDLVRHLAARRDGGPYQSLLHRPAARGPWHLLIRERTTRLERGGGVAGAFAESVAVSRDLDLQLRIAWGTRIDRRRLRTVRHDRLLLHGRGGARLWRDGHAEVRFAEPQREILPLADEDAPLEVGLIVPSTLDRHERLVELDERSPRFRGLAATLRYDPGRRAATVRYLNDSQEVRFGELYALGEGFDQVLVRFERTAFPRHVLVDLALLALFAGVFLGRAMTRSAVWVALLAPTGLLLACRLLFAFRAGANPPHFYVTGYAEARLALWLVPSAILFGRSLGWLLRRPPSGRGTGPLRWPILGLTVAGCGCLLGNLGAGNLPWLGVLPWTAALVLYLVGRFSGRPPLGERLHLWQREGLPWRYRWLLACAALVVLVRVGAWALGLPETVRLPAVGFRMLWTVVQLPFCAAVFALGAHLVDERRQRLALAGGEIWQVIRDWLLGIAALGAFLGLAYFFVAVLVDDLGLLIVHALAPVFTLLLLVAWPRLPGLGRDALRAKLAYGAGVALVVLPFTVFLLVNVAPDVLVRVVGWGGEPAREEAAAGEAAQAIDVPAQLSSAKALQLFRLYMLANPGLLSEVGLEPSERLAIHYHTLQSYAEKAGLRGQGFASSQLPRHLGTTYLSDLVAMVFVLGDFGTLGVLALALLYLLTLLAVGLAAWRGPPAERLGAQGTWIAAVALLAFVLPSLYMILANLNFVLFTGKNCGLLGLNSVSDVLESAALLGLAAFGLGLRRDG